VRAGATQLLLSGQAVPPRSQEKDGEPALDPIGGLQVRLSRHRCASDNRLRRLDQRDRQASLSSTGL
jgi:hypothetical protein